MNRILELKLSNDEHTRNTQAFQEQTSMEENVLLRNP